jgi:4-hydroxy-3-polyprenylbenzoate decarboxylase
MQSKKRVILAITGASGAIYGVRALAALKELGIEVHLILSPTAASNIHHETGVDAGKLSRVADHHHACENLSAPIASGSFQTDGMLVLPCSIKTLSGIANSYAANLIQRAADVTLKEGRPLLLAVRETPFHIGHLRLMQKAAEAGAIISPPIPAFYDQPKNIEDLIHATVGRMLARIGIENDLFTPWQP